MIEYLSLIYTFGKDIYSHINKKLTPTKEDLLVNNEFLKISGIQEQLEKEGLYLGWSKADKVKERELKGYEIFYGIDKNQNIQYRLVDKSGGILMVKPGKKM